MNENRTEMASMRFTPGEMRAVRHGATTAGMSVSDFVRRAALDATEPSDPLAALCRLLEALNPLVKQAAEAYYKVCKADVIEPEYDRGRAHALDELHRAVFHAYWDAVRVATVVDPEAAGWDVANARRSSPHPEEGS